MPSTERPGQLGFWEFLLLAAAAFGAYFALTLFPHSLRGPAFLIYYGAVWIGLFALTWTMRLVWRDSWLINFAAIAVFEALGYHRYQSASAAGMHKFGYLFVMMVLGGLAFLFGRKRGPADPDDESGSSSSGYYFMGNCSSWTSGAGSCSSGSSCSSGGSCGGGGGCGGGGCGGCGGS